MCRRCLYACMHTCACDYTHTHVYIRVCVCIVTCLWIRKMLNTKMYQLVIALRGWRGVWRTMKKEYISEGSGGVTPRRPGVDCQHTLPFSTSHLTPRKYTHFTGTYRQTRTTIPTKAPPHCRGGTETFKGITAQCPGAGLSRVSVSGSKEAFRQEAWVYRGLETRANAIRFPIVSNSPPPKLTVRKSVTKELE